MSGQEGRVERTVTVILDVFKGAYKVYCITENPVQSIQRASMVRLAGREEPDDTPAMAVSGPPFKKGQLVQVSQMGLPNDWKLCVVLRNDIKASNTYVVDCGYEAVRALPKWVREDDSAQ